MLFSDELMRDLERVEHPASRAAVQETDDDDLPPNTRRFAGKQEMHSRSSNDKYTHLFSRIRPSRSCKDCKDITKRHCTGDYKKDLKKAWDFMVTHVGQHCLPAASKQAIMNHVVATQAPTENHYNYNCNITTGNGTSTNRNRWGA